nr:myb-like protein X [Ipomoea batatas]
MDMKRRLPEWMVCMPAAGHGKKKSETQDISNGENVEEVEVTKKSKMKDVKDGQVKKISRTRDASNGESGEERVKKKSKTKYTKCGEHIDGKVVEKETRSRDVNTCETASDLKLRQRQTGTKHTRARARHDAEDLKGESCLLVRCETTQRSRRKVSLEDNNCNYESDFEMRKPSGVAKNIDEAEPPLRRQKTKAKSSVFEITDKNEDSPQIEDDEDFSVQDLMSIAEEYASEDEDLTVDDLLTLAKECVNEECKGEQNMSSPRESTAAIPLRDTDISAGPIILKGSISAKDTSSSEALPKPNITGSPTQDMLNLFLGPLLKKTQEEKEVEVVRDDIYFAYDRDLKSSNRNVDLKDLSAPLAKKKSSLKDKVAMLFD